jgi:hypothetical protein
MERWYGKGGMERVVKSKQSFDLIRITLALFLVWEGWYGISGRTIICIKFILSLFVMSY